MAKRKVEKQNNSKLKWLIICLLMAVIIFFTVSKMGIFGIVSNNLLSYAIGSLYIIPVLTLFLYSIYNIFFDPKNKISDNFKIGLFIVNLFVILLSAYMADEMDNFTRLGKYLIDNFKPIFENQEFAFTGGILGNFMYVLFTSILSRAGTLIVMILLFVIAMILIIPSQTYKNAYNNTKSIVHDTKQSFDIKAEERKLAHAKAEEERKARQAEQMARLAEEEELRRQQQEEAERARLEQERLLAEKQEEERLEQELLLKKKEREKVLSKSPTFINLNEDEIYDKKKPNKQVENNEVKDDIPLVKQVKNNDDSPKVLKPKRNKGVYKLPKPYEDYLDQITSSSSNVNKTSSVLKGEKVIDILKNFGISAQLMNTYIGPSVTKFEIKPDSSVKINRIMNISDNIKMELAAKDIRIEAPIPGRSAVGIEIPNVEPIPVRMLDLMKSIPNELKKVELLFALGKDLMGKSVYCDLAKMPHLLIAGATGSGKSVCINAIITSFLLRSNPDDVKLVLVDPKKVEFTPYKDIPHLIWPIIDDPQMASNMLKKVVVLMEERYDAFAAVGVRNITAFNDYVMQHNQNLKDDESLMQKLPYMVVIIDELADLMAIAGKDVELSIQRITQLARASGIHLIVATQRPSTDVITGLIKSNIPSRISFAVASSIDSRTILDQTGAERLLGNGDMLYYPQGESAPIRMQGVYVTDKEIARITKYVKSIAEPEYEDSYYEFLTNMNGTTVMSNGASNADAMDSLFDEVVEFVRAQQKASTSLLQRRFGIGYNRAARLIDTLEDRGLIGPANGSKPREVYLNPEEE